MNKDKRGLIIIGVVAALLIGLIIWLVSQHEPSVNWNKSFKEKADNPYDISLLRHTVEATYGEEFVTNNKSLSEALDSSFQTYFFIGEGHYPDSSGLVTIKEHVRQGNTAYIISQDVRQELMEYLYFDQCNNKDWSYYTRVMDSVISIRQPLVTDTIQTFKYEYKFKGVNTFWHYVPDEYFCNNGNQFAPLGYFDVENDQTGVFEPEILYHDDVVDEWDEEEYYDDEYYDYAEDSTYESDEFDTLIEEAEPYVLQDSFVNFYQVKYGKGTFYFHTQPLVFTNYYLRDTSGFEYVSAILEDLPQGKLYWDTKSRVPSFRNNKIPEKDSNPFTADSITKHILNTPQLKWAFYILVGLGLLYILFQSKRRQRVIPVLDPNDNQSLDHSKQIANIYFKQNSNTRVAKKIVKHLLFFIKEKYNIQLNLADVSPEQVLQLSKLSKKTENDIQTMLTLCKNVQEQSYTTDNTLFDLYTITYSFKHE